VVQADGLRWDELYALTDLIASALDVEHHGGAGAWHHDCPACTAITAHNRITAHKRYQTVGPHQARNDR
jgi:hypothetical protein